jgi:hypothetical protein
MWLPVNATGIDAKNDVRIKLDLTGPVEVIAPRPNKIRMKSLQYDAEVFVKMLTVFESARPKEAICWATGRVDELGQAHVKRYWGCELEYASEVGAKTSPQWLSQFVKQLRNEETDHNLVLENHSHPIGSRLSRTDQDGLYALYDWSWDMYWVMTACDFQLGVHTIDDDSRVVRRIPWGVEGVWAEHEALRREQQGKEGRRFSATIHSTTSNKPWVDRVLGKFRE